jgi:predicted phosphate transport protein (TIGR00153 family)
VKFRLLPRNEDFFSLFVEVANRSHTAADHLYQLFSGDGGRLTYWVEQVKRLEHEADELTHEVVNRLDRTFITPIDREDIHLLSSDLDDVIDRIDAIARRAEIFRLGPAPQGIRDLCEVLRQITAEIATAMAKLKARDHIIDHCIEAKRLEEVGDAIYHAMLGKLFDEEKDPIALIKWKEIYDKLEAAIDDTEDVANDLQSIVLKNA